MSVNPMIVQPGAGQLKDSVGRVCPLCEQDVSTNKWKEIQERERKRVAEFTAIIKHQLETKHQQEIEAAKLVASKQAKADADKRIATVTVERDRSIQKVKQLEARETEVRRQVQEDADRKVKQTTEEADKKRQIELREQRQILDKDRDRALLKKDADFNREREAYQKKFKQMEQQLQRKTANELGDGAEIDLFEALKGEYRRDQITRVKKGEQGADIIHEVLYKGEVCGRLVYDSKNRQQWRDTYATKLREDQVEAEAEHAILTTTVFPSGEKELCIRSGVIVTNPARAVYIVGLLRAAMIKMHQQGLSNEQRSGKKDSLYRFIASEEYSQRMEQAIKLTDDLSDVDVQEKKQHDKVWQSRGLLTRRLNKVLVGIDTEVNAILEGGSELSLRLKTERQRSQWVSEKH